MWQPNYQMRGFSITKTDTIHNALHFCQKSIFSICCWLTLIFFFRQEFFLFFLVNRRSSSEWRQETTANGLSGLCRLWWTAAEEHDSAPSSGRDERRGDLHRLPTLPLNCWSVCGKYLHAVSGSILKPWHGTRWQNLKKRKKDKKLCGDCVTLQALQAESAVGLVCFLVCWKQATFWPGTTAQRCVVPDITGLTLHYCKPIEERGSHSNTVCIFPPLFFLGKFNLFMTMKSMFIVKMENWYSQKNSKIMWVYYA